MEFSPDALVSTNVQVPVSLQWIIPCWVFCIVCSSRFLVFQIPDASDEAEHPSNLHFCSMDADTICV